MSTQSFEVWATSATGETTQVGKLITDTGSYGSFLTSRFIYHPQWLEHGYEISPDLPLTRLGLVFTDKKPLPGALADTTPDSWGRRLIRRQHKGALNELEYLLRVSDETRMGNLRIKMQGDKHFLRNDDARPLEMEEIPRYAKLAAMIDRSESMTQEELQQAADIYAAGTSAGGARPKITTFYDGALCLIKFKGRDDDYDHLQYEKLALEIAALSGVRVPPSRLVGNDALVLERFDRTASGRLGYISGRTVLNLDDDEETPPYELLLDAMRSRILVDKTDLHEMFNRVAVNIGINNVDDHSRNHGFLRKGGHWRLSPVFDLNPEYRQTEPGTPLREGNDRTFENLLAMSASFGLSLSQARERLAQVELGLSKWRDVAREIGIDDYEDMAGVFDTQLEELRRALLHSIPVSE
ncbi:MAG: type II toxin-antitoxin system HipA family toxin [Ancrocorticia sp.]